MACALTLAMAVCAQEPQGDGASAAAERRPTIELAPDPGTDAAITRRLTEIFGALSGLEEVAVTTEAGVVTLSGAVARPRRAALAGQLAEAVRGVVAVENELVMPTEVDTRVRSVWNELSDRALDALQRLPLWLVAGALVIASWFAGAALGRAAQRGLREARNPFVGELVRQIVRLAALIAGVMLALLLLDAGPVIGSLLGSLGLIGLAIGFAVRDTIENYLASVLLSLRQPFKPHDLVSIDGREGRVLRLNSRATMLMDPDGNHVRIPNALVYKATIVNYDLNPERRFSFEVGIDSSVELTRLLPVAERALAETPGVLRRPAPVVTVSAFGAGTTNLLCYGWVNQRQSDLTKTRGAAMAALQVAFEQAGIRLPVPRYAVTLSRPGQAATTDELTPAAAAGRGESALKKVERIDVSRDDQTELLRAREAGPNLLADDAPTE